MIDIPKLFTAVAEWGACMLFISFLKKRGGHLKLLPLYVAGLLVLGGWHYAASYFPRVIWALGMLGAVILMVLFVFGCCKVKFVTAVYWGVTAFCIAECVASVEWQTYNYLYVVFPFAKQAWVKYLCFLLVYAFCFSVFWAFDKKFFVHNEVEVISVKTLISVVVMVLICFLASNVNFLYGTDGWSVQMIMRVLEIRSLVDLCGVILLYSYRMLQNNVLYREEKKAMYDIIEKQYLEYRRFKENDEAINRHYHDLKHQIDVILSEGNAEKRSEDLKEMRRSIQVRQSQTDTGNKVMDVLLTAKSLDCVESDINFTVVADGKLLNFMSTMDLCSVLGNAVDNAIESARQIQDKDKRLIQLAVYSNGGWVVLRVRNYFERPLKYKGNEIITTKKESSNHGYGLKSIKFIAEKYGGNMTVVTKNNWFTLCLLFPAGDVGEGLPETV